MSYPFGGLTSNRVLPRTEAAPFLSSYLVTLMTLPVHVVVVFMMSCPDGISVTRVSSVTLR